MGNNFLISKVFWKFHFFSFFSVSLVLLIMFPFLFGVENSNYAQSAYLYDRYFSLVGMVLFLALYSPDTDKKTLLLVKTKKTPYIRILLLRFIQIIIALLIISLLSILSLHLLHSKVDYLLFLFSNLANSLFLGGLFSICFSLVHQLIPSLMIPIFYYIINFFTADKYLKFMYLFSLSEKNILNKEILFLIGLCLINFSFLICHKKSS